MDMRIAFILALSLAGCSTSETVYLERLVQDGMGQPQTQSVTCGPYTEDYSITGINPTPQQQLRECVRDFQAAGYERVQGPQ